MTFGGSPAKCLMLPTYATIDAAVKKRTDKFIKADEHRSSKMDTFRFGRKLSLPSTIAIKHQVRMVMADDRVKEAEEAARAHSTDTSQIKVGPNRLTTQPPGRYGHRFAAAWLRDAESIAKPAFGSRSPGMTRLEFGDRGASYRCS
jgi:hypothetical protein